MANEVKNTENTTQTHRRSPRAATFVVVLVALLIGVALMYSPRFNHPVVEAPSEQLATTTISGPVMAESEPVRIKIPAIDLDAPFSAPLGLDEKKEVEVPKDYVSVGYYKFGPTPGELGPAVVLGHVDSFEGPAVLYSLGKLKEGDTIEVERKDGSTAVFAVTEMERNSQDDFPTEKVYGKLPYAGLRLITCTGVYDRNSLRYSHNLIVYAKLVGSSTD